MNNIFDYKNYSDFLRDMLPTTGEGRGIRSKLAIFLECRVSHLTQVIQGRNHLSIEMALKTSDFLNLTEAESHFFILLVSFARAGTFKLRSYYEAQIEKILSERKNIQTRLEISDELTTEQIIHYYSSWHYSAIHILCSLPEVKNISDIEAKLKLSVEIIQECVNFLIEIRILIIGDDGLKTTGRRVHLGNNSRMVSKHHTNWRIKTIEELGVKKNESLHFSAVYSFALEDWNKIKEILLKSIKMSEEIIIDSPQDTVGALCIDFFSLIK